MKRIFCVCIVAMLTGCATTTVTPEGEAVRVASNQQAVEKCQLIGEIVAKDTTGWGDAGAKASEENAYRRLKNQAAERGADTVLISSSHTGYTGTTKRGEAYRCGQ